MSRPTLSPTPFTGSRVGASSHITSCLQITLSACHFQPTPPGPHVLSRSSRSAAVNSSLGKTAITGHTM
ncbi:hypothetical protein B0H34DRAFT_856227, partial [Crassisporium funariophilum]